MIWFQISVVPKINPTKFFNINKVGIGNAFKNECMLWVVKSMDVIFIYKIIYK